MLTGKRLAAHGADERPLVGMGPEMRTKVVRSGEAFRAQRALKGGRMLLDSLVGPGCGRTVRVGEFQNVVPGGNGGCG